MGVLATSNEDFTLSTPTNIADPLNQGIVKMFPNPTSEVVYLILNHYTNEKVYITLYNSLGKPILHTQQNQKNIQLNLSSDTIPAGNYILKVKWGHTSKSWKVIKR